MEKASNVNGVIKEEINNQASLNGKTNGSSILSGHQSVPVRYSDSELNEFKDLIERKLKQANEEWKQLSVDIGNTTDDTSPRFLSLDDAKVTLDREDQARLAKRLKLFIQCLENALLRIENKTYGIDHATGKLIPKERLRLVPHATKSVETKLQQKKPTYATMHTIR